MDMALLMKYCDLTSLHLYNSVAPHQHVGSPALNTKVSFKRPQYMPLSIRTRFYSVVSKDSLIRTVSL